ncbi:MAG: RodZ domain-containing protein [bacterium]
MLLQRGGTSRFGALGAYGNSRVIYMSNFDEKAIAFGQELAKARQYKGLTLEQISEVTKVQLHYLQAMEEGRWDFLPKPYLEAFLKAYAEAAGMNIAKVMTEFREMISGPSKETAELTESEPEITSEREPQESKPIIPLQRPARKRKRLVYSIIGLVVLIAIAAVLTMLFIKKNEKTISSPEEKSAPVTQTTRPEEPVQNLRQDTLVSAPLGGNQAVDSMSTGHSQQQKPREGFKSVAATSRTVAAEIELTVKALENCWLRATLDHQRIRDMFLYKNETLKLRASMEIHLIVGNAGGIELILDGKSLGKIGPTGQPATLIIGPEGVQSQRLGVEISPADTSFLRRNLDGD